MSMNHATARLRFPSPAARQEAVAPHLDTRDITNFARRHGDLPSQQETDKIAVGGFLHRDGSVISTVTPEMLIGECATRLLVTPPFKAPATTY